MKKVVTILVVVLCVIVFTGCTDQTNEFEERIELENEIKFQLQLVDPEEDGSVDEDGNRED